MSPAPVRLPPAGVPPGTSALARGPIAPAKCAECPFAKDGKPVAPVRGIGPLDPDWIIWGEGPGQNEIRSGIPFVGASGEMVNKMLKLIRADRDRIWIGNSTLCLPLRNSPDSHRKIARDCCRARVVAELSQFPGKPMLALGAVAAQGFLGEKFSITQMSGSYWEVDIDGTGPRGIIPSVHPAAILRGGAGDGAGAHAVDLLFWNLCYDGQKVFKLAAGTAVKWSDDVQTEFSNAGRALQLVIGIVKDAQRIGVIACDTETYVTDEESEQGWSALQPRHARLKAIGLATPSRAVSISWALITPPTRTWIARVMADARVRKVFHNALYDVPVLRHQGFPVKGRIDDTLLMHHNAFPGGAHGLQTVATQLFVMPPWKAEFREGEGTIDELTRYNCLMMGTPVMLADGSTELIERLVRRHAAVEVLSLGPTGIEPRRVTGWHDTRVPGQSWLQIRTAANARGDRGIILTPDHEVYLRRGKCRADQVTLQDEIATAEVAFTSQQRAAVLGTALGDSLLSVMSSYRRDRHAVPTVSLQGGHKADTGYAQWKVACLAPHARGGRVRATGGYCRDGSFQPFHTRDLHQLVDLYRVLYDTHGQRQIPEEILPQLGPIGWAWWFMDDGCRQNARYGADTVTLALCRYRSDEIVRVKQYLTQAHGKIWAGRDRVLRFSKAATESFCDLIAPYVIPSLRYKLPRGFACGPEPVPLTASGQPVYARVTSVGAYTTRRTDRVTKYQRAHRYCLTVEGNHNFFTAFGLVANCRDVLSTMRLDGPMQAFVDRSNARKTYEVDLEMARVADRMADVGVPLSRDINRALEEKFGASLSRTRDEIEAKAYDDETWPKLIAQLAKEQAKRPRKGDPLDYPSRIAVREQEIAAQPNRVFLINSGEHVAAFLKARGVPLYTETEKGKISTKKDLLEGMRSNPEVGALLEYRESSKMHSTFVVKIRRALDEHDRFHSRWSVHKITGRWGAEDPQVMNYPKQDDRKGRPNMRTQVIAPPGRKFVGFDMCFSGETLVDTPYGPTPICDLKAGSYVYSYDFTQHRVVCSRVRARRCTGRRATLVVVLDNGAHVRCTPDHVWYVRDYGGGRDAREVPAGALQPGDRLLPLRRSRRGAGPNIYSTLYSYSAFEYTMEHQAVAEAAYGPCPDGYDVHHKNEKPQDNRPENLAYKHAFNHASDHAQVSCTGQWRDPAVRQKMRAGISASIEARGGYHGERNPNYGRRTGVETSCLNCGTPTYKGGKHPKQFCSQSCFNAFRKAHRGEKPRDRAWTDLNHKVVDVIRDGRVVPVYDIEVETYHNFALAAGVFVHNCQLEARLIALGSGDPFLVKVFAEDRDLHSEVARIVFPDFDRFDPDRRKKLRDTVKRPEYGAFYGGDVETLYKAVVVDHPDIKLQDLVRMVQTMKKYMPGVDRWHDELMREVQQRNELRSVIYGRRRCFPLGNANPSEVYNFPVQSSGADIMATGIMRIMPRLPPSIFPILQIHDAMVFECDEANAEWLRDLVVECFTQEHTNPKKGVTVKFPIETRIGDSWAEADDGQKCNCAICPSCGAIFNRKKVEKCSKCGVPRDACAWPDTRRETWVQRDFCLHCFRFRKDPV